LKKKRWTVQHAAITVCYIKSSWSFSRSSHDDGGVPPSSYTPEAVRPRARVLRSMRIVSRRAFHDDELFRGVREQEGHVSRHKRELQRKTH